MRPFRVTCLIFGISNIAPPEFFHSKIDFSDSNLEEFHSAFRIATDLVFLKQTMLRRMPMKKKTKTEVHE